MSIWCRIGLHCKHFSHGESRLVPQRCKKASATPTDGGWWHCCHCSWKKWLVTYYDF